MARLKRLQVSIAIASVLAAAPRLAADAVTDWNAITAQTVLATVPARPVPITFLDFAVVHVAVHDAVQAFENEYEPYAIAIPGASGSVAAAVAKAAHDVLVNRFPAQAGAFLDTTYHDYLLSIPAAEADPGVAVGAQAAAAIIALRSTDGTFPESSAAAVHGQHRHRHVAADAVVPHAAPPPSNSPMAIPWLASVTPFTLTGPSQFRPRPPPG